MIGAIRGSGPLRYTGLGWRRVVGLVVVVSACGDADMAQSLAKGFTSAREERVAKENPAYARRLHIAAQLARSVKTDSLRKLYLTALEAPAGRVDSVWNAISCVYLQQIESVGAPAAQRAQKHVQDSLIALPGTTDRWRAMTGRLSGSGTLEGCILPPPSPIPDSVQTLPMPNVVP